MIIINLTAPILTKYCTLQDIIVNTNGNKPFNQFCYHLSSIMHDVQSRMYLLYYSSELPSWLQLANHSPEYIAVKNSKLTNNNEVNYSSQMLIECETN